MRGSDEQNGTLFSSVNLEDRVPDRHPLRVIRQIVNVALARLDAEFASLYAAEGRPSIPPEQLLRAVLIQACPRESGDPVLDPLRAPIDGADAI